MGARESEVLLENCLQCASVGVCAMFDALMLNTRSMIRSSVSCFGNPDNYLRAIGRMAHECRHFSPTDHSADVVEELLKEQERKAHLS